MVATFEKDKNYLLGYHPHSLFGVVQTVISKKIFEKCGSLMLTTGASVIFKVPLLRRYMAAAGLIPATAVDMKNALNMTFPFNTLTHYPGGIGEMFYGVKEEQIILDKRKGWIKIA